MNDPNMIVEVIDSIEFQFTFLWTIFGSIWIFMMIMLLWRIAEGIAKRNDTTPLPNRSP